jgi:hypothetical protein
MEVDFKRKHAIMKSNRGAEYKNIIHRSFKPVYLFSKALGVMPLSYTRKNSVKNTDSHKRNTNSMEVEWSWKSAAYSGVCIALFFTIRYLILITRPHPPPPKVEADDHNNSTAGNFINSNNSQPPSFPNGREHVIGSMNDVVDFTCNILAIITGVVGARKIPEIFRHLQDLDENSDEDGYVLLGKSNSLFHCVSSRIANCT